MHAVFVDSVAKALSIWARHSAGAASRGAQAAAYARAQVGHRIELISVRPVGNRICREGSEILR